METDQNNTNNIEEILNEKLEKLIEKSKAENAALRKILLGLETMNCQLHENVDGKNKKNKK